MPENRWSIENLFRQLDAIERDARKLVDGLSEDDGARRPSPKAWSVAECLDHLAISNRAYLRAMQSTAIGDVAKPASPERDANPGRLGRWMVWTLEPPVKKLLKTKAPASTRPRRSPGLKAAAEAFFSSHREVTAFLREWSGRDLTAARFTNPFLPFLKFSLAAGLQIAAVHERRHLWQAWRARAVRADPTRDVTAAHAVPSHRWREEKQDDSMDAAKGDRKVRT